MVEIRKRQLELEASLIKKRLEAEVASIEADESDHGSAVDAEDSLEKVDNWLKGRHPSTAHGIQEPAHASRPMEEEDIRTEGRMDTDVTPHRRPTEEGRRHRVEWNDGARTRLRDTPRSPSPTPRRHSAERGRAIEQLAEALEKMSQSRPPPRQATELPTFTGAATEWLPFKVAMRDSTLAYKYSRMENMARLRHCLKGEAREAVASLLYTATDPEDVMKTLEQRFGRPELIVQQILGDIRRLPQPSAAPTDLNAFATKVQNAVCAITNVKRDYLQGTSLAQAILNKMGRDLRTRWCDYAERHADEEKEPIVLTLSRFLMQEADKTMKYDLLPEAAVATKKETKAAAASTTRKRNKETVYAAAEETKDTCLCCKGDHDTQKCPKLRNMDVDSRWAWARTENVCFRCMKRRHRRGSCKAKSCGTRGCRRPHHALLHTEPTTTATEASPAPEETAQRESTEEAAVMTTAAQEKKQSILLKMCPVTVAGPGGEIATYALLDEGSTVTLIDEGLASQLRLDGPRRPLKIQGVNASQPEPESRTVKLRVRGRNMDDFHHIRARTVKGLRIRAQSIPRDITDFDHLRDLAEEVTTGRAVPRLLIGADHWHLIITRDARIGRRREPVASRTELGWVIHGVAPRIELRQDEHEVFHAYVAGRDVRTREREEDIRRVEELVKTHFKIEALGVSLAKKMKPEDKRATEIFNNTVKKVDEHYETGLVWRHDNTSMPPSYACAAKRLRSLEKKMDQSATLTEEYSAQIQNLLSKGYAVECDGTEEDSSKAWFLPHFAVRNPNKPGKVRLVFDAAARSGGVSLNDRLIEGPDLLKSLPGILFRFRERPIAVTADIEEMFLQVKIRPEDQPAQMFLWRGQDRETPPKKYKMTSMIFGASCSPFLAHSVRDRNATLHAEEFPEAERAITGSHYMDDYVDSFDEPEAAIETIRQVIEVHKRAHFCLRGWNSNRREVMQHIPEHQRAHSDDVKLGSRPEHADRTLGLLWEPNRDRLGFNTAIAKLPDAIREKARPPTKREALSAVMSVFDPLGLVSHFTIAAKILLQNLWRKKIEWDEEIPDEEAAQFTDWLESLREVTTLRLPRCYSDGEENREKRKELHVFCDASEQAYAAAAYWRMEQENGNVEVTLIAAKARVAPLRTISVPRLELQAAVLGARLADTIRREHRWKPEKTTFWSDSRTVLRWIEHDAVRYTPFVAHRLGEIAELTEGCDWRWTPTDQNVADEATRPKFLSKFSPTDRWFTGPAFLKERREHWPAAPTCEEEDSSETVGHAATAAPTPDGLPDIGRFSSYDRLVRTTALLLLFPEKSKNRRQQLEVRHLEAAERLWILRAQADSFPDDLALLQKGKPIKRASRLRKLDPVLHDGMLHVRGRTGAAHVPAHINRPVILDGRHPFTRLLVQRAHRTANHANHERVVNELRQRYWILHLRPTVRAVARDCALCRLRRATPTVPVTGDLPSARLDPTHRPFSNCGVDYFGPLTVTIGRRHEKRWVALFTCLTTRAVHLELVASLSTDSAIMALRRMAARRGWPRVMYSDNATNFRGADVELRAAYTEWMPALREVGLQHRMDWRFIPPGAPHMGGAWERLVRSVKAALTATLRERAPREEALLTLLTEAEHSVNSRPLTHVSVDPNDPEALTPNHFLLGSSSGLPHTGPCNDADRRAWRATQALADSFWQRWVAEYLPTLVPRGRPDDRARPLKEGDVVIIVDPTLPRNVWPRGVVQKTYPGPDRKIRSADVRTTGGVFRRPTTRLVVLTREEAAAGLRRGEDVADACVTPGEQYRESSRLAPTLRE